MNYDFIPNPAPLIYTDRKFRSCGLVTENQVVQQLSNSNKKVLLVLQPDQAFTAYII